ncbi:MAG TPA: hypothetical protein VGB99_03170 [Acidobacteriota bacterium]
MQAADGILDPTFGANGTRTFAGPSGNLFPCCIALDASARILVAGYTIPSFEDFNGFLARFTPNGEADVSFGAQGYLRLDFGSTDIVAALALQSDGKIVVAGSFADGAVGGFDVVRLLPDGSPDPEFGQQGMAKATYQNHNSIVAALAIQSDGKILVGGLVDLAIEQFALAVARFDSDGSLDPSFGDQGWTVTALNGNFRGFGGMALQHDDRIVVVGSGFNGQDHDFLVARFLANGPLDTPFAGQGWALTDFGGTDWANSVALHDDGRILAAGRGITDYYAWTRYLPDGSPDLSLARTGRRLVDDGPLFGGAEDLALQSDGKVILAGPTNFVGPIDFGTLRYFADGQLDLAFGAVGAASIHLGEDGSYVRALAIQPDGKIVLVGWVTVGNSSVAGLARLLASPVVSTDILLEVMPDAIAPGLQVRAAYGLSRHPAGDPPYLARLTPGEPLIFLTPGRTVFSDPITLQETTTLRLEQLSPPGAAAVLERTALVHEYAAGSIAIRALSPGSQGAEARDLHLKPGDPLTVAVATTSYGGDLYAAVGLPTGEFYCFTGPAEVGPVNTIVPLATGITDPHQLFVLLDNVTLPPDLPAGVFALAAALAPAGCEVTTCYGSIVGSAFSFEP